MNISINHPVTLYGQPTNMTCWSAAATMMFGTNASYGPGQGELGDDGGLLPSSVPAFAHSLGLNLAYPQSWSVEGLADLLQSGPLLVMGAVPYAHAYVISAMSGDGSPNGTLLTVYDPWPPGRGAIWYFSYGQLMQRFPMATEFILSHPPAR